MVVITLGLGGELTRTPANGSELPALGKTVMVRLPTAALASTLPVIRTLVEVLPVIPAVMPPPLNTTFAAPARLSPEIAAENAEPAVADVGEIDVTRIELPDCTTNPLNGSGVPLGV